MQTAAAHREARALGLRTDSISIDYFYLAFPHRHNSRQLLKILIDSKPFVPKETIPSYFTESGRKFSRDIPYASLHASVPYAIAPRPSPN